MRDNGRKIRKQRLRYLAADFLSGNLAFFLFNIYRHYLFNSGNVEADIWSYILSAKLMAEQCLVPVAMLPVNWMTGYYNLPFGKSRLQEFITTLYSSSYNTLIIFMLFLVNDTTSDRIRSYGIITVLFLLLFMTGYFGRLAVTQMTLRNFRSRRWNLNVLIIGNSVAARRMARYLTLHDTRISYNISGYVRIPGENDCDEPGNVYALENLREVADKLQADLLIVVPESVDEEKTLRLLYHLIPLDISIRIAPDTFSLVNSSIKLRDIHGEPFVDITSPAISESSKNIKRLFDVSISVMMLVTLSPLLLLTAALVRFTSPGPVVYRQERIGLRRKPFTIYKFRTMCEDAEENGPQLSGNDDTRITGIGKFLRRYRIDELLQFWNVVKGDMSIVGPRPERKYYIDKILKKAPYYALVCNVRPGITSWGMVKFGYASTIDEMVARTRYDMIYLNNMSLTLDIKIMIYTLRTLAGGKGI